MSEPRTWTFSRVDPIRADELSAQCGLLPMIAQVLLNRGIDTPETVHRFLRPSLDGLHDPFLLSGMKRAVERVRQAIDRNEKIVVYGDFDVDGTVSTALMMLLFRTLGANASYYIPKRLEEGYGLNVPAIARLKKRGCSLLITVDNGITAVAEVQTARSLGMDVVVTDHHVPGEHLPSAYAIINPKQPDCTYPHQFLAGIGVAFKLIWGIAETYTHRPEIFRDVSAFLETALGLVCIATVADVVPLIDENRIFVSYGLQAIPRSPNPGLRALLDVCNLTGQPLDTSHIGFRLAPRLNAGGRLGNEDLGVRMLLADSYSDALVLAQEMELENKQRQEIERKISADARQRVLDEIDLDRCAVIVLASDEWHPGVIGIVASRISEEFWRPAVMIAMRGRTGRGSARSIPGFSIYRALSACEDLLLSFGGHDFAAGMEIHRDDVDQLRERLNATASDMLDPTLLHPALTIDGELSPHAITAELIRQLDFLAPHGEANPAPLFATPPVRLVGRPRLVGKTDQHISFFIRDATDVRVQAVRCIAFNQADMYARLLSNDAEWRLAFSPRINRYRNSGRIELVVKDIHTAS